MAAIVGAILVAGCSGGVKAVAAQCPAAPGVTAKQLTFGMLYPAGGTSGPAFAPYRAGVDARLGVANASGGINGRQINYTWADDNGQADTNLAAAQQLVSRDKVFAIQESSTVSQGSAPWLNREDVPVVGTSDDLVWAKYRNMFSYFNLVTDSSGSVSTWGDYAKIQGVTKAAILFSQQSDGSRLVGTNFRTSLQSVGIQTEMIEAEPTMISIPSVVRAIKDSGANLITGIIDAQEFIEIALAARKVMPDIKILSVVGYDAAVLAVGRPLAGMSVFVGFAPFEHQLPVHRVFLSAMAKYAPQQQPAANEVALSGWVNTDLLLRGLAAAGRCPTRQSFMTNLRGVSDYTAGGLLLEPVNMGTIFGRLSLCYSFLQISPDGKSFDPVGDGPLCGRRVQ